MVTHKHILFLLGVFCIGALMTSCVTARKVNYMQEPDKHIPHYADTLTERYKIEVEPGDTGYELLEKAGRKRGFLMRGAQVDTERMARILLDEFRAGKLGRSTLETVPTEEVTP